MLIAKARLVAQRQGEMWLESGMTGETSTKPGCGPRRRKAGLLPPVLKESTFSQPLLNLGPTININSINIFKRNHSTLGLSEEHQG